MGISARSQIVGPFIEGDDVYVEGSSVRCMPHKVLRRLMRQKAMYIIITSQTPEGVVRIVFANGSGDVVVSNIFPNDKACVLEVMEAAAYSKDVIVPKEEKGDEPPQ